MNRTEVQELLELIQSLDRRPFPAGAMDAWHRIFERTEASDAVQATLEHFDQPEYDQLSPGMIRRRAAAIAEHRARVAQRALQGPPQYTEPNQEYIRARGELARRLGNLDRAPSRVAA